MKIFFTVASALALMAAAPTLSDIGSVRASGGSPLFLTEASGPTGGGHDTALYAEASLPSPGGRDTALAEASTPTSGGRDTALYAEANLGSPGGHDNAQG